MTTVPNHTLQRVAIPHYGRRIMPRFGLARQFYLLTVDGRKHQVDSPINFQWDPRKEPSVARWLKQMKVSGVICDGIHPRFQTALKAEGLWVLSGTWGEIGYVIERWLKGQLPAANKAEDTNQESCCRPTRNHCHDRNCPPPPNKEKTNMKIAVTAQEPTLDSPIDPRFGRAPWLMIYDPTNDSWQSIDNSAGLNAAHGAGIQAAQKVVDQHATAIITGAIGPKAYRSLQAAGVQIFHGAKGSVTQALQAFQAGDLAEANTDDATGGI